MRIFYYCSFLFFFLQNIALYSQAQNNSFDSSGGSSPLTAQEYCRFLNHLGGSDFDHHYDEKMRSDFSSACILRKGQAGSYSYSVISNKEEDPVFYVSEEDFVSYKNSLKTKGESEKDILTRESDPALKLNLVHFLEEKHGLLSGSLHQAADSSMFIKDIEDIGIFFLMLGASKAGYDFICDRNKSARDDRAEIESTNQRNAAEKVKTDSDGKEVELSRLERLANSYSEILSGLTILLQNYKSGDYPLDYVNYSLDDSFSVIQAQVVDPLREQRNSISCFPTNLEGSAIFKELNYSIGAPFGEGAFAKVYYIHDLTDAGRRLVYKEEKNVIYLSNLTTSPAENWRALVVAAEPLPNMVKIEALILNLCCNKEQQEQVSHVCYLPQNKIKNFLEFLKPRNESSERSIASDSNPFAEIQKSLGLENSKAIQDCFIAAQIMEQAEGDEIEKVIKSNEWKSKKTLDQRLDYFDAMIQGIMEYLYTAIERNFTHRDIKPSNLFFKKEEGQKTGKLTILDPAFAIQLDQLIRTPYLQEMRESFLAVNNPAKSIEGTMTALTALAGTPSFMTKAQFLRMPYGAEIDAYAFAKVLLDVIDFSTCNMLLDRKKSAFSEWLKAQDFSNEKKEKKGNAPLPNNQALDDFIYRDTAQYVSELEGIRDEEWRQEADKVLEDSKASSKINAEEPEYVMLSSPQQKKKDLKKKMPLYEFLTSEDPLNQIRKNFIDALLTLGNSNRDGKSKSYCDGDLIHRNWELVQEAYQEFEKFILQPVDSRSSSVSGSTSSSASSK